MRYKCVGNPICLKTFEYGHALRAHIAACETAQKILKSKSDIERLEHEINVEYPGINGLHRNQHYPTSYSLDQTLKLNFRDEYKFGNKNLPLQTSSEPIKPKRMIKEVKNANGQNSDQIKLTLTYQ
jgi:hypothetical protein